MATFIHYNFISGCMLEGNTAIQDRAHRLSATKPQVIFIEAIEPEFVITLACELVAYY